MALTDIPAEIARWILDITGTQRVGSAVAALDFPNILAQTSAELTIAVLGALPGDVVQLGNSAAIVANLAVTAMVNVADTVTVRMNNYSAGALDPASATYTVVVSRRAR